MGRSGSATGDSVTRAGRAQVVHESERTRVTRLFTPDGSMIRKEPRGPGAERLLRHEMDICDRLSGVGGVPHTAQVQLYPGSILFEDVHGASLADVPAPLEVGELTRLAIGLARVVADMHARG